MGIFTKEFIASQRYILNLSEDKHDWNNYLSLQAINEIESLQHLISAYENDLVLMDVAQKLEQAEKKIADLESELELHQTNRRLLNRDLEKANKRIAELEKQLQDSDDAISDLTYEARGYDKRPYPKKEKK